MSNGADTDEPLIAAMLAALADSEQELSPPWLILEGPQALAF
jgi:hypothetical protein